jgi:hypothetical protein
MVVCLKQHIFEFVVVVGFVANNLTLLREVKVKAVKPFDITHTARRQEKLDWLGVWCDQQMHLQPIEVAFLTGLIAAIALAAVLFRAGDAVVVTGTNRKCVVCRN